MPAAHYAAHVIAAIMQAAAMIIIYFIVVSPLLFTKFFSCRLLPHLAKS